MVSCCSIKCPQRPLFSWPVCLLFQQPPFRKSWKALEPQGISLLALASKLGSAVFCEIRISGKEAATEQHFPRLNTEFDLSPLNVLEKAI